MSRSLPSATSLTGAQYNGWACIWCGASIKSGGIPAGRAEGRIGAHDMGVNVYACSACLPIRPNSRPAGESDQEPPTGAGDPNRK